MVSCKQIKLQLKRWYFALYNSGIYDYNIDYLPFIHVCLTFHSFGDEQVYPRSWTALYMPLDNVGMWNIRSENWARQYLGQQFYLRVYSPVNSWRDEYPIPIGALLCGRASGRKTRPL